MKGIGTFLVFLLIVAGGVFSQTENQAQATGPLPQVSQAPTVGQTAAILGSFMDDCKFINGTAIIHQDLALTNAPGIEAVAFSNGLIRSTVYYEEAITYTVIIQVGNLYHFIYPVTPGHPFTYGAFSLQGCDNKQAAKKVDLSPTAMPIPVVQPIATSTLQLVIMSTPTTTPPTVIPPTPVPPTAIPPVIIPPTAIPPTAIPPTAIPSTQLPATIPPPSQSAGCDPSYPDVCIAPYPPDLDCPEIPYVNFHVIGPDPHRFDADHDGIGCEDDSR